MNLVTYSPSGANCPYYFKGGILRPLKYGSFFDDMDALKDMIMKEEDFILHKQPSDKRCILLDLYETNITAEMVKYLVEHIIRISYKIWKLAIVGCNRKVQKLILKQLKVKKSHLYSQILFHTDMETAKDWLVSEKG